MPGRAVQNIDCQAAEKLSRPTPEQAAWQDLELGMFIHFGPATYEDIEEDNLSARLDQINPDKLDTDQWVQAAKDMGAGYIMFVAKHSGGFCAWQTDTTTYGIKNTPWRGGKGDILADLSASCRKQGVKLGVYISPSDRHFGAGTAGSCANAQEQEKYNKIYRQQLTEILTRYGDMIEVWFDGSLVVPVGDILQKHAPRAQVFQGPHATIRWVGNEEGWAPYPAWNAVPLAKARSGIATAADGTPNGDAWLPNECDTKYCASWHWKTHYAGSLRSLDDLMKLYYNTVGHGAVLLLNHAPDRTGLIPEAEMRRGREFGAEIRRRFGKSVAETSGRGQTLELALPKPTRIDHVIVMENILEGERVREYVMEGFVGEQWKELCRGSAIGHKKIDAFGPLEVSRVRLRVVQSAAEPMIRKLAAYNVGDTPKLSADAADDPARQVWQWSAENLGKEWKTVDIDLTSICKDPQVYQVDFHHPDKVPNVEVRSLELLVDGVVAPGFVERTQPDAPRRYYVTITALSKKLGLRAVVRAPDQMQSGAKGEVTVCKRPR